MEWMDDQYSGQLNWFGLVIYIYLTKDFSIIVIVKIIQDTKKHC